MYLSVNLIMLYYLNYYLRQWCFVLVNVYSGLFDLLLCSLIHDVNA